MEASLESGKSRPGGKSHQGFTAVELVIAFLITAILAVIAIPAYLGYVEKSRVTGAVTDIRQLETAIDTYHTEFASYPGALDHVTDGGFLDPWENGYAYLNIQIAGMGEVRRDKSLNPLNTDYDLYSMGNDGLSRKALGNKESLDDVIRANDGAYVGLASRY
jgi:general secretion pathway protein G